MEMFQKVQVLDGGFASALQAAGHQLQNDALWGSRLLLTNPEAVLDVHKSFVEAGASIIETNSYQAVLPALRKEGLSESEAISVLQGSVGLAKTAADGVSSNRKVYVAGSVGPYAAQLCDCSEYTGVYVDIASKEDITEHHFSQAKALWDAGVDMLAFETVPALAEAECILKALERIQGARAWISFSCKDSLRTCYGDLYSKAVSAVSGHPQISAIGVNCTAPEFVSDLLRSAQTKLNGKAFIVYPNSGEAYSHEHGWEEKASMFDIAAHVKEWIDLGARAIGGCCRVYACDIARVAQVVQKL